MEQYFSKRLLLTARRKRTKETERNVVLSCLNMAQTCTCSGLFETDGQSVVQPTPEYHERSKVPGRIFFFSLLMFVCLFIYMPGPDARGPIRICFT